MCWGHYRYENEFNAVNDVFELQVRFRNGTRSADGPGYAHCQTQLIKESKNRVLTWR